MNHLPFYIPAVFVFTSFLTVYLFYQASNKHGKTLMVIGAWMAMQAAIASTGFFTVNNTLPPRFILLIIFPVVGIVTIFSTQKGKLFVDQFNMRRLTLLHSIRILVELVLFWLFLNKALPQLMTFEGRNFDLLSGITAPLVFYFGFVKKKLGIKTMLAWNFICLAILLFTVSNAVLSAPTPLQQFGFEQPTIAVFYFPFVWLPGMVVPLVIFSHLITIRSLLKAVKSRNVSTSSLIGQVQYQ